MSDVEKWTKMCLGHLVALPVLGVTLVATISLFLEENLFQSVGVALGGVTIVGGLLYYLWTRVWLDDPSPTAGPDKPWHVRDEWTDSRISTASSSPREWQMPLLLLFGSLFAAVAGYKLWQTGEPGMIFGLAAGGGMLVVGGYRLVRYALYGETVFDMATYPAPLGDSLCGTVYTQVSSDLVPDDGFRVRLACYEQEVIHSPDADDEVYDDYRVERDCLWEAEKQIEGRPSSDGKTLDVPVYFDVPLDQPSSTAERREERIMWMLEVSADRSGVDYAASLEIPVFPVEVDESVDVESYAKHEIQDA